MRTVSKHTAGLIATIILGCTIGLWILVHAASGQQHRCDKQTVIDNVSLIKLI